METGPGAIAARSRCRGGSRAPGPPGRAWGDPDRPCGLPAPLLGTPGRAPGVQQGRTRLPRQPPQPRASPLLGQQSRGQSWVCARGSAVQSRHREGLGPPCPTAPPQCPNTQPWAEQSHGASRAVGRPVPLGCSGAGRALPGTWGSRATGPGCGCHRAPAPGPCSARARCEVAAGAREGRGAAALCQPTARTRGRVTAHSSLCRSRQLAVSGALMPCLAPCQAPACARARGPLAADGGPCARREPPGALRPRPPARALVLPRPCCRPQSQVPGSAWAAPRLVGAHTVGAAAKGSAMGLAGVGWGRAVVGPEPLARAVRPQALCDHPALCRGTLRTGCASAADAVAPALLANPNP